MKVIVAGEPIELGATEERPTISIVDYSRRETDDFGVTTVVERGFARRMSVRLQVPFDEVDHLQRTLAGLRATAVEWIADETFDSMSFVGFYKDFSIDMAVPPVSFCTLNIEGLAESTGGIDDGSDPAPDQQASTLHLLQPVTISNSILTAINVPETDYPAWVSGTTYPFGGRVIRAHRKWESTVVANLGNEPAQGSAQWIDLGPTNRWAMFDQALGTLTEAAGSIVAEFDPVEPVNAVAVLDVTADSVRVQAAGYDRTIVPNGAAGMAVFLDLPATSAGLTITISGSDISVGTMLIGNLLGLGVTEASPTAGITDYSRKDADDFGEVTVVERAWSKRMAVNALLRTDAVDTLANRIAAVRARPCLWIGDADLESLSIYGFFKDFSIEVSENVSRLALTVEGLSKAAPIAPFISQPILVAVYRNAETAPPKPVFDSGEVPAGWSIAPVALATGQYRWSTQAMFLVGSQQTAWTDPVRVAGTSWQDVYDNDPDHPKPADGATVGAPAGTPIGNAEAQAVVDGLIRNALTVAEEALRDGTWRAEADTILKVAGGATLRQLVEQLGVTVGGVNTFVDFLRSVDTDGNAIWALTAQNSNGKVTGVRNLLTGEGLGTLQMAADILEIVDPDGGNARFILRYGLDNRLILTDVYIENLEFGVVTRASINSGAVTDNATFTAADKTVTTAETTIIETPFFAIGDEFYGRGLAVVSFLQDGTSNFDTSMRVRAYVDSGDGSGYTIIRDKVHGIDVDSGNARISLPVCFPLRISSIGNVRIKITATASQLAGSWGTTDSSVARDVAIDLFRGQR